MREAGRKYAQLVEAKGRREHDLGSPHLHVFLAFLSTLAMYVPQQGVDQAVEGVKTLLEKVIEHQTQAELGEWVTTCRAEDCYDRLQQEKTGSHPVCHERNDGSVVAPFRPETSNPASSSWAAPTSRGNHDEADERTERARLALVRARWEAQGGGGPTRRESTSTRQVAPTRSQTTEPSILLLLEGRTPAVPLAERDTSTFVMNGSTCRAAPRLKWDSGGSLQRPRHAEQPAPREQILVATQVL